MDPFPHHYAVTASGGPQGDVILDAEGLPPLLSEAPAQFGGPGTRWSPETLMTAAVGDCLILTFRGVAGVRRLPWTSLSCDVDGTLDRVDRVTRFTRFHLHARLEVPEGTDVGEAERALARAEAACLVSRSLNTEVTFDSTVVTAPRDEPVLTSA